MRLRLDVAYDGSGFSGWAVQPTRRTVQGELQAALATLLHPAQVTVTCAGRTDAGVHARGQVCHVDVDPSVQPGQLRHSLTGRLPHDLRVRGCAIAADGFDARFSALWRRYVYRVCDDPGALDPLRRHETTAWHRRLDASAMDAAAGQLLGQHDFAAFCRRREGASTIRTLLALRCRREDSGHVSVEVVADAFCHNMVRSLVGALVAVGEGRRALAWPGQVLAARVRDSSVLVMPPHGLTLEEVGYPADANLSARAEQTRSSRVVST